jgi:hypothetical protein
MKYFDKGCLSILALQQLGQEFLDNVAMDVG